MSVRLFCLCHTHIPQVGTVRGEPKKAQAPLLPLSIPSHFLFGFIHVCLCYIYHVISRAHRCHRIFPLIMSSRCLETPCDKSVASTFEIQKAQGLVFFFLPSKAVWLAASSAATSHPQSTLSKGIIQSDVAVYVYCGILIVVGAISK